ncbi:hypothetical protein [Paraburkholderia nemoris]|uniref:hypothetical protein n=1 Tax=Paraburkholderia nemoris TaxID=2793076 RepID=UPI001B8CB1EF|nr:hypothetical protein [Paraburkholderia nemoris]
MSSRDIRKARRQHGRNALNPALPMSAALEALGAHLRDARRNRPERVGNRPARGIHKGK